MANSYEEKFAPLECECVEDLFPETITKEELLIEHGTLLALKRILKKEKYINDDMLRTILGVTRGEENE